MSALRSLVHLGLDLGDYMNSYDEKNPPYTDEMFKCVAQHCPLESLALSSLNAVLGPQTMSELLARGTLRKLHIDLKKGYNGVLPTETLRKFLQLPSLQFFALSFTELKESFEDSEEAKELLTTWLANPHKQLQVPAVVAGKEFVESSNARGATRWTMMRQMKYELRSTNGF